MRVNERGTERFKDKNVSVAIVERTAGSAARCFTQLVAPPLLLLLSPSSSSSVSRIRCVRERLEGRSRYLYKRKRRFHGHYSPAPGFFYGLPDGGRPALSTIAWIYWLLSVNIPFRADQGRNEPAVVPTKGNPPPPPPFFISCGTYYFRERETRIHCEIVHVSRPVSFRSLSRSLEFADKDFVIRDRLSPIYLFIYLF